MIWKFLRGLLLNNGSAKQTADCIKCEFFGDRKYVDTVVFVHGLGGDFSSTWGMFPQLLRTDLELPAFDILLWGYNAGVSNKALGVAAEGKRMLSDLRETLQKPESLFLIAHSLGGLTVLHGICTEHADGRARRLPAAAIRHLVLYATPALGVSTTQLARLIVKQFKDLGSECTRYIEELCAGAFVNSLIREVADRIYRPDIQPGDENSKRRIPITACVATYDEWVDPTSAEAIFSDPPAVPLAFDHANVKLPVSHEDRRYSPVRKILRGHFNEWFHALAKRATHRSMDGSRSAGELLSRCSAMIEFALSVMPDERPAHLKHPTNSLRKDEFLRTLIEIAEEDPEISLAQAVIVAGEVYVGRNDLERHG